MGTELMKSFKVRELIYLQARNFVQRTLRDFRDTRNDFYVVYRLVYRITQLAKNQIRRRFVIFLLTGFG